MSVIKPAPLKTLGYLRIGFGCVLCLVLLDSGNLYGQSYCSSLGVVCKSGSLSSNETWSSANIYVVTGSVTVPAGVTLTIQTGTVIKFNVSTGLVIVGVLEVNGTLAGKVYFTSVRDDTLGGDTNGDGGNTTPYAGSWERIYFNSGGGTVTYAEVRYAGSTFPNYASIYLSGSSPTLSNVTVLSGGGAAISAAASDHPIITVFRLHRRLLGAWRFEAER